ncbi:MAG: flavodoxin family protein [Elusimicrobia bacterium]|nr:flavodoxin family protein [Elusimicrobiota bacterium]
MKKMIIIIGSPKKKGNTSLLVDWFIEGASSGQTSIETVNACTLNFKSNGCTACRQCQDLKEYECAIKDGVTGTLRKMALADIIVIASPMYFFGPSAQLKTVLDRMFCLYKFDNDANTFTSPLKGKTLLFIGSAYESMGIATFEKPFSLTAEYSRMKYDSLVIADAGVSGDLAGREDIRQKAVSFGRKFAA